VKNFILSRCGKKYCCPNKDAFRMVLSFISDISRVRYNIWL